MPKFETNQVDVKSDGKVILYQRAIKESLE